MKIKAPDVTSATRATPRAEPTAQPQQTKEPQGWQARTPTRAVAQPVTPPSDATVKQAVTQLATAAVSQAILSPHEEPSKHPILEKFGKELGLGLGVVVTEALALLPGWNKPVLDANGAPVAHVEGADRVGDHDILKRHQEVVGPQIAALVDKMHPGALRDLLDGLAKGASQAPGASYRLEAMISDRLHGR